MSDYISRDAAQQAMWNALYALEDRQEAESGLDIMRRADVQAGFEAGQQVIAEFPAADVVPVRHGRWIVSATNLHFDSKCSACGETFYSPLRGAYIVHHAKYCPNCGAKMYRGQDEAPAGPYDLLYEEGGLGIR